MKKSILTKSLVWSLAIAGAVGIYSCQKGTESEQITETSSDMVLATDVTYSNTSTHLETGFENGTINPFQERGNVVLPAYVKAIEPGIKWNIGGDRALKFYWEQSVWDATGLTSCPDDPSTQRDRKSVEVKSDLLFKRDGWFGFGYMIPVGFPTDRESIIAQGYNEGGISTCNRSWVWHLSVKNGTIQFTYRTRCGVGTVTKTLVSAIQYGVYKPVVIQWRPSQTNHGKIRVWHGQNVYDKTAVANVDASDINLGWGTWSGESLTSGINIKFGIYAHDCCTNYGSGDKETVYFDNVSQWLDDAATNNGFDTVDPTR